MIADLLAGAAQLGLTGLALRRVARRVAAGLAASLLVLGVLLLAVAFAAAGAFLSLADAIPPAWAALAVAGGLAGFAGLLTVISIICWRQGTARLGQLPAGRSGANAVPQALAAFAAGVVAGNAWLHRR